MTEMQVTQILPLYAVAKTYQGGKNSNEYRGDKQKADSSTDAFLFSEIPWRLSLTWVATHKDSCWHSVPHVGMTGLRLARPGLDVAKDQLPSPWSLGAPAGKDICQRESWQLYFLFHLGLSLIHPSCSFFFSFIFFLLSSKLNPTLLLLCHSVILSKILCSYPVFISLSGPSLPFLLPLA